MITKRERQKVHAHEWEEIGKDFDKGETLTSIALRFSVSSVTIRNILLGKPRGSVANEKFVLANQKKIDEGKVPYKLSSNDVSEILRQIEAGGTAIAIAKKFKISRTTVYNLVTKHYDRLLQSQVR